MLIKVDGHDQLIVNFPNRLAAYDPKTGRQLWLSKGLGSSIYATPLWGDGLLVGMSAGIGSGNAIAVKPGGDGDITDKQRLWRSERIKSAIGSGVIYGEHVYMAGSDGVAVCLCG